MSLFFYAALVAGLYLFARRLFGVKDTKEDEAFRSNVSASLGNALPKVFGGMSTASMPEPDTSDGFAPHGDNVLELAPPSKPAHHPFRAPASEVVATSAVEDAERDEHEE